MEIKNKLNGKIILTVCKNEGGFYDLKNANLENANLSYVNLNNANLSYVNLNNAKLKNANLENANLFKKGVFSKKIIQIFGLNYYIYLLDDHIKIGCEIHTREDWENFTDDEISKMDSEALDFWRKNKENILNFN